MARNVEARTMPSAATIVSVTKTGMLMRDGSIVWMVRSRGGCLLSDIQEMADSLRKSVSLAFSYSAMGTS